MNKFSQLLAISSLAAAFLMSANNLCAQDNQPPAAGGQGGAQAVALDMGLVN